MLSQRRRGRRDFFRINKVPFRLVLTAILAGYPALTNHVICPSSACPAPLREKVFSGNIKRNQWAAVTLRIYKPV